jgi:hypothetical protein
VPSLRSRSNRSKSDSNGTVTSRVPTQVPEAILVRWHCEPASVDSIINIAKDSTTIEPKTSCNLRQVACIGGGEADSSRGRRNIQQPLQAVFGSSNQGLGRIID